MKKLALLLVLFSSILYAQNDRNDKIKAIKTAFITERLDLSSQEAEKFWPIYNAYEDNMGTIRKSQRKEMRAVMNSGIDGLSDSDANAILDTLLDLKGNELKLQRKLVEDLKIVIPSKKILKLRKAEEDFKQKLLERLKNRRGKG